MEGVPRAALFSLRCRFLRSMCIDRQYTPRRISCAISFARPDPPPPLLGRGAAKPRPAAQRRQELPIDEFSAVEAPVRTSRCPRRAARPCRGRHRDLANLDVVEGRHAGNPTGTSHGFHFGGGIGGTSRSTSRCRASPPRARRGRATWRSTMSKATGSRSARPDRATCRSRRWRCRRPISRSPDPATSGASGNAKTAEILGRRVGRYRGRPSCQARSGRCQRMGSGRRCRGGRRPGQGQRDGFRRRHADRRREVHQQDGSGTLRVTEAAALLQARLSGSLVTKASSLAWKGAMNAHFLFPFRPRARSRCSGRRGRPQLSASPVSPRSRRGAVRLRLTLANAGASRRATGDRPCSTRLGDRSNRATPWWSARARTAGASGKPGGPLTCRISVVTHDPPQRGVIGAGKLAIKGRIRSQQLRLAAPGPDRRNR